MQEGVGARPVPAFAQRAVKSAATAELPRPHRPVSTAWWVAVGALFPAALIVRLVALGSLPASLTGSELEALAAAWLGVPESNLPAGLATLLLTVSRTIFGPTAFAARFPFALASAVTLLPLVSLARRFLSPGAAWVVGLVWATAPWSLVAGRDVEPGTLAPLLLLTAWWLLVRGWESGHWIWGLVAGVVAGMGFLGDPAGRVVPLTLLGLGLVGQPSARNPVVAGRRLRGRSMHSRPQSAAAAGEREPGSHPNHLRQTGEGLPSERRPGEGISPPRDGEGPEVGSVSSSTASSASATSHLVAVGAGLVVALIAAAFVLPGGLGRVWTTYTSPSIFAAPPELWPGLVWVRLANTLRAFFLLDGVVWDPARPFPPGLAVFDAVTGILLVAGLVLGVLAFRRVAAWWLLLLLPLVVNQVLGAASPDLGWATVALPAFTFFVGLAWDALPLPTLGARRLAQVILLGVLAVVAIIDLVGLYRWQTSPEYARARQPAVPAEALPDWTADQERLVATGQSILDPVAWSQQRSPVQVATPPGQPGRPGQTPIPAAQPAAPASLAVQPVAVLGGAEGGPLAFQDPAGLAFAPDGGLWIADSGNRRVLRLSPTGELQTTLESVENSQFEEPWDLAADANGTVYVLDSARNVIIVLGPNGERRGDIGQNLGMFHPRGIAVDPDGNLVVADTGGSRVLRIRPSGDLIAQLGGRDNQLFNQPTDVAVDQAGNLYVVEPEATRITRFAPGDQLAATWPIAKTDTRVATRLAITPNGLVGLVSPASGRLEVFAPTGQPIAGIDLRTLPPFNPAQPFSLAIQGNRAAVADLAGDRIGLFEAAWPGQ